MFVSNLHFNSIKSYTVADTTDSLRALLTVTSSITAYDAATANSWVPITSAEYFRLSSTLPGIKWHGTNETGLKSNATGSSFNTALTVAMASGSITSQQVAPANTYFVGFMTRPGSTNTNYTWFPMSGYTHKDTYYSSGSATYRTSASVPTTSSSNVYYIRKAPTTSLSAASYIGYGTYSSGSNQYLAAATNTPMPTAYATTKYDTNHTIASAGPVSAWSVYSNNLPIFQLLGTTVKNWPG
jgi:hypothetical protein